MIFANTLYTFKRAINQKTGEPSTRYNMTGVQGLDILKTKIAKDKARAGQRFIYHNKAKGKRSPDAPEMAFYLDNKENTGCFEPDLAAPGAAVRGFGDVNPLPGVKIGEDAILYERSPDGGMVIAVYCGHGEQADKLYQQWQAGLVCFGLSYNKPYLVSKSDTEPEK